MPFMQGMVESIKVIYQELTCILCADSKNQSGLEMKKVKKICLTSVHTNIRKIYLILL